MTNNKTILVVEDETPLARVLKERLAREGFRVLVAYNGKEGLEVALEEHPDLLLLDIVMPVMDGMTMIKELRKDEWGKDAQVILLTNLCDNLKISESMETGVHDYLVKSDWTLEEIVKKINEKLAD